MPATNTLSCPTTRFSAAVGTAWLAAFLSSQAAAAPAFTAIDLHPAGIAFSRAYGISAAQQAGDGIGSATGDNVAGVATNSFTQQTHAFLWLAPEPAALELSSTATTCLALIRCRRMSRPS